MIAPAESDDDVREEEQSSCEQPEGGAQTLKRHPTIPACPAGPHSGAGQTIVVVLDIPAVPQQPQCAVPGLVDRPTAAPLIECPVSSAGLGMSQDKAGYPTGCASNRVTGGVDAGDDRSTDAHTGRRARVLQHAVELGTVGRRRRARHSEPHHRRRPAGGGAGCAPRQERVVRMGSCRTGRHGAVDDDVSVRRRHAGCRTHAGRIP